MVAKKYLSAPSVEFTKYITEALAQTDTLVAKVACVEDALNSQVPMARCTAEMRRLKGMMGTSHTHPFSQSHNSLVPSYSYLDMYPSIIVSVACCVAHCRR